MPQITYLDFDSAPTLHCTVRRVALTGFVVSLLLWTITKLFGSLSLNLQLGTGKGKAKLIQTWTGPGDSRRYRLPDFKTIAFNPYPTAFPYGNGMVLHFYQQQESSTTKTVHKVINKGLKTYV